MPSSVREIPAFIDTERQFLVGTNIYSMSIVCFVMFAIYEVIHNFISIAFWNYYNQFKKI